MESEQIGRKSLFYPMLDEADRMWDIGLEPQITKILYNIHFQRPKVMFNATCPD